jgi:membrane-associated phospholipid phosphatase
VGSQREPSRLSAAWALRAAALCVLGLALTWVVAELVPVAHTRDAVALHDFTQLGRPRLDSAANALLHLLDPLDYTIWGAILVAIALLRGRPRVALAVALVLPLGPLTAETLKPLLAHAHDHIGWTNVVEASWPSGHSTAAMTLALCAVLVVPARLRPTVAALGALFAVAVGFSLLLLAWHMPSDVFGGYLVAALWATLAVAALRAADTRWPSRSGRRKVHRAAHALRAGELVIPALLAATLAAIVAVVVLARAHQLAVFASDHRSLLAVAVGISALAVLISGGLTAALRR